MTKSIEKFKKVVVLDTVIFYPEHRRLLNSIAEEVLEYPSSLPENLEKQYEENPEKFIHKKCYTQIAADNIPAQLLMGRIEGADVVLSCWTGIPDDILKLNPQLKLVIFWTHEKEHRINLKLAKELSITVTNIPDYGTDSVSEVVFAGLWELLKRNFSKREIPQNEDEIMHSIMNELFNKYRRLNANEKYTRSGKFTHHFHKLGLVDFDFKKKGLNDLIPEKLIENKHIGLLNIKKADKLVKALQSFSVLNQSFQLTDSNLAEYYKFLSDNELIFYHSQNTSDFEFQKINRLAKNKLIDIQKLTTTNYSFDGKIFGVIGLGRIGTKVAKIAKSLGFEVVYYSRTKKQNIEREVSIKYVELKKLAESSDIISLHVPAYKAENLIDKEIINSIKKGAIFINTADGNSIDQHTLTQRMLKKEVFAYLDVYPGLPRKDILGLPMIEKADWKIKKELSNNVLAYRAGWKTQESVRVKTYKLLGEMIDYLIGQKDKYRLPEEL